MDRIFNFECVAKHVGTENPVVNVPMTSMKNIFLELHTLSFAENAKYGEFGRWPATHLFKQHFPSFLENGFEAHREPLDIKFDLSTVEADKGLYMIKPFSVGYIDGQNKAMIMLSILALLDQMVSWQKKISCPNVGSKQVVV